MDYKILSISWDFLESFDSEVNLLVSIHVATTGSEDKSLCSLQHISLLSPKSSNGKEAEFH